MEGVTRYAAGAFASAEELAAAERHLARCSDCRARVRQAVAGAAVRLAGRLAPEAPGSACLPPDLIARYAAGAADAADWEVAATHVADCALCAGDVAAARAFRQSVAETDCEAVRASAAAPVLHGRLQVPLALRLRSHLALRLAGAGAAAALAALLVYRVAARPLRVELARLHDEVRAASAATQSLQARHATESEALAAQVARLQGDAAQLRRENDAARLALREARTRLAAVDRAASGDQAGPAARVIAALQDGGRAVTLDSSGRVGGLAPSPGSLRRGIARALATRRVEAPRALAALRGPGWRLMGPGGSAAPFALRSPVGVVVRSARPTFHWAPLGGAARYAVTVVDDRRHAAVARGEVAPASDPAAGLEWTVPENTPLPRGRVYRWYVVATLASGDEVQSPARGGAAAKFRVLPADQAASLARAATRHAGAHLTLGVLYLQAGLLEDAVRELQALAAANPASPVARDLLESVRSLRGASGAAGLSRE